MLVLAIGDFFIPTRACELPPQFVKLLKRSLDTSNSIEQVICLGNITASVATLKLLNEISPKLHMVKGEEDDIGVLTQQLLEIRSEKSIIPLYNVINVDKLKVGFTLGSQTVPKSDPLLLLAIARDLDVDILIWGGTHKVETYAMDGKFFINPGSASGAYSFDMPEVELDDEENISASSSGEIKPEIRDADNEEVGSGVKHFSKQDETKKSKETDSDDSIESKTTADTPNFDKSPNEGTIKNDSKPVEVEYQEHLDFGDIYGDLENVPSFCLLDVQGTTCNLYIYTCLDGEVKVDKVIYQK